jgi:hypothetical protein
VFGTIFVTNPASMLQLVPPHHPSLNPRAAGLAANWFYTVHQFHFHEERAMLHWREKFESLNIFENKNKATGKSQHS